jgi:hypothetical protein
MKLCYIDIATKNKCRKKQGKRIKTCCHHRNKRIKLGIHHTQAKPKKTFAITKNGNVDA